MLKNIRPPGSGKLGMRPLSLIQREVINAVHAALGSGSIVVCLDAVNRGLVLRGSRASMFLSRCSCRLGFTVNTLANHIGLAQALFELGETEQARSHLDQVRQQVGGDAHWFRHAVLLTEAYFAFRQGREEEGLALAAQAQALALSRQTGVSVFVYWRPALTALVCSKALAVGIETEYVQGLIGKLHLLPDPSSPAPAARPWPLKIIARAVCGSCAMPWHAILRRNVAS